MMTEIVATRTSGKTIRFDGINCHKKCDAFAALAYCDNCERYDQVLLDDETDEDLEMLLRCQECINEFGINGGSHESNSAIQTENSIIANENYINKTQTPNRDERS